MARGEREAPLRRAAIDIMVNAAENGLIEDEDRDTIIPILFMQDASTTAAAAEGSARDVVARFFGDMFKEEIREAREREEDEKADQAGGDSREENQQEWLDLKHLAASLYKYSCMTEELVGDPRLSVTSSSATKESSTACLTKQDVLALLTRPLSQDLSTAASLIGDDEHTRGGGADETMISMDQAIEEVVSKWTLMDTVVRSKARLQLVQSAVSAATTDDSAWCAYDMVQDSASTQTESSSSSNTKESLHAGVGPLRIKAAVEALWGHVDVLKVSGKIFCGLLSFFYSNLSLSLSPPPPS